MSVTIRQLLTALGAAGRNAQRASQILHTGVQGTIEAADASELLKYAASFKVLTPVVHQAASALSTLDDKSLFEAVEAKPFLATLLQLQQATRFESGTIRQQTNDLSVRTIKSGLSVDELCSLLPSRALWHLRRAVSSRLLREPLKISQLFMWYDIARCGAHFYSDALQRCVSQWNIQTLTCDEIPVIAKILRRSDGSDNLYCLPVLTLKTITAARNVLGNAELSKYAFDIATIAEHASNFSPHDKDFVVTAIAHCRSSLVALSASLPRVVSSHLFGYDSVKWLGHVVADPRLHRILSSSRYGLFRATCIATCHPVFISDVLLSSMVSTHAADLRQFVVLLESLLENSSRELCPSILCRCIDEVRCAVVSNADPHASEWSCRGVACVVSAVERWGGVAGSAYANCTQLQSSTAALFSAAFPSEGGVKQNFVFHVLCIALNHLVRGSSDAECISSFHQLLHSACGSEFAELADYFYQSSSSTTCARISLLWLQKELSSSSSGNSEIHDFFGTRAVVKLARCIAKKVGEEVPADFLRQMVLYASSQGMATPTVAWCCDALVASGECHPDLFAPLCDFVASQPQVTWRACGLLLSAFKASERQHRKDVIAPVVHRTIEDILAARPEWMIEEGNMNVLADALSVSSAEHYSLLPGLRHRIAQLLKSSHHNFNVVLGGRDGLVLLEPPVRSALALCAKNARNLSDLCFMSALLNRMDFSWPGLAPRVRAWINAVSEDEAVRIAAASPVRVASLLRKCEDDGDPLPDWFIRRFVESVRFNERMMASFQLFLHLSHCRSAPNSFLEEVLTRLFKTRAADEGRLAFLLWKYVNLRPASTISQQCVAYCVNCIAPVVVHMPSEATETIAFTVRCASVSKGIAAAVPLLAQLCAVAADRIDGDVTVCESHRVVKVMREAADLLGPGMGGELWARFHPCDSVEPIFQREVAMLASLL